jgi:phospholipid/cholesterol/gamma-HCH transport system substrate-binding protein
MSDRNESQIMRIGIIALAVMLLVMVASFNIQKLPWLRGAPYHAELVDASGLHIGSEVQVAGIRVGRVNNIRIGTKKVIVDFDAKGATLGRSSRASVEVQNLLGEKFLNIASKGSGKMPSGSTIPVSRTDVTFDIVGTLSQLTTQTEQTNKAQLSKALSSLADVVDSGSPEVKSSFTGLTRLSQTVASRDEGITTLLARARNVTKLLDERKGDLVTLMKQANLIFQELQDRKQVIHQLLVNANQLAVQLEGVVEDNTKQLKPALDKLENVLGFLHGREDQIETLIHNYGPYVNILGNIVGSGPWFDAYVPNITGVFTGEFKPGPLK